jgi:hypothetical protein
MSASADHTLIVTIEICGIPTEVEACFDIEAFSTPDDWETGGGSGVEIDLKSVWYSGDGTCREITDVLRGMRDLELRYSTYYPNRVQELLPTGLKVTLGKPARQLAYGYGFSIGRRWEGDKLVPDVVFNQGRTLFDAVEMEVINHVGENERDYIPVFDDDV